MFYDSSHEELHVIAGAVEEEARETAARLLEAKQLVEFDLGNNPGPETIARDLDRLVDAANLALRQLDLDDASCGDGR